MLTSLLGFALLRQTPPKAIELSDASGTEVVTQLHLVTDEDDPALPVLGDMIAAQADASFMTSVVVLPGMMRIEARAGARKGEDAVTALCRSVTALLIDEGGAESALRQARHEMEGYVVQSRWGYDPIGAGDPDQQIGRAHV